MPVAVECDNCGKRYKVNDDLAGDTIPCKECGEDIRVPGGRRGGGGGGGGKGRRKGRSKSDGNPGLIIGAAAGGVAILALIAFVVFGRGGGGLPAPPAGNQGAFAPNGAHVNAAPNPNPNPNPGTNPSVTPGPPKSRFDQPVVTAPAQGSAPKAPVTKGNKNPSAGVGLGNVVGVTKHWRQASRGQQDATVEFKTLQESPDQLPPDLWSMEADPPAAPIVFEPKKKQVRVKIPIGAGGRRTTTEDILFPCVPSPFVAVGTNAGKKDDREIWNLATGTKVATITGLSTETTDGAISPDGKYFVARTGRMGSSVSVYDIEEKKPLGDLTVERLVGNFVEVAVPRPNLVVIASTFGSGKVHIFELPSGTQLHTLDIGWRSWNKCPAAFTPGGRFMALSHSERGSEEIWIHELETGINVGKLSLPSYDIGTGLKLDGMAFSNDGKELACIVNGRTCSKVLVWNVTDGSLADHMTFPKLLRESSDGIRDANPLSWFPDGKRLLAFERSIIDRDMGTVVWQLPKTDITFTGKRRALDNSHVTVIDVSNNVGYVLVYELPEERIKQSAEKLAKTATTRKEPYPTVLVEQPASVPVDYSSVQFVAPKDSPWSVKPDPAPASNTSTRPVALTTGGGGSIREVAVSRGDAPKAVALRSTASDPFGRVPNGNIEPKQLKQYRFHSVKNQEDEENSFSAEAGGRKRSWVDIYDLKTGQKSLEIRMKSDGDLMGLSSDGTRFLVWAATKSGRLDLYSAEDGKAIVGWNPYAGETGEDNQTLVAATLIDAERALTMNAAGRLVVWKLPEAKALYAIENASQPALSPGGKYLGYSDGQAYYLVDLSTGQAAGKISDVGDVNAVAFHPGGTRMALLSAHKGAYYLFSISLTDGQASPPFPVPVLSGFLHWCGDRYVLLDNQKLVDIQQRVVAWTYELTGDHLPASPDGRHWFLSDSGGKPQLSAALLPGNAVEGQLQGQDLQPEFLLTPGGKCSLNIQLGNLGDQNFVAEVEKKVRDQLTANKITVEPGQGVILSLTAMETVGQPLERNYHGWGFGRGGNQTASIPLKTTENRIAFEAAGGAGGGNNVGWERSAKNSNNPFFLRQNENESLEQAIQRVYQEGNRGFFNFITLPPYVFTPRSANGIGTTKLGN